MRLDHSLAHPSLEIATRSFVFDRSTMTTDSFAFDEFDLGSAPSSSPSVDTGPSPPVSAEVHGGVLVLWMPLRMEGLQVRLILC